MSESDKTYLEYGKLQLVHKFDLYSTFVRVLVNQSGWLLLISDCFISSDLDMYLVYHICSVQETVGK